MRSHRNEWGIQGFAAHWDRDVATVLRIEEALTGLGKQRSRQALRLGCRGKLRRRLRAGPWSLRAHNRRGRHEHKAGEKAKQVHGLSGKPGHGETNLL